MKRYIKCIRCDLGRRTKVNYSLSVENFIFTVSKPGMPEGQGSVWRQPTYCPHGTRHKCSVNLIQALLWNCRNLSLFHLRERHKERSSEAKSTKKLHRGGASRISFEIAVMAMERRGCIILLRMFEQLHTRRMNQCPQ